MRTTTTPDLSVILDRARIGVLALDGGRVVAANEHAAHLLHRSGADLAGLALFEFFPHHQTERLAGMLVSAAASSAACGPELIEYPLPGGGIRTLAVTAAPAPDVGTVGLLLFHDAPERPAIQRLSAETAVARILATAESLSEAATNLLRAISEHLGWDLGQIWQVDEREGRLRWVDAWHHSSVDVAEFVAVSRSLPLARGEGLPGRVWAARAPAWISRLAEEPMFLRATAAAPAGFRSAFAFPILLEDRVLGAMEFFSSRNSRADEDLLRMVGGIGSQIGQFMERKRVEAEVRESEARKAAILRAALDAIITIDQEGRVVEFNPAAESIFGYALADVQGRELAELIMPPPLRESHRRALARCVATGEGRLLGQRLEMTAVRADGAEFPVELTITRISSQGPPLFTGHLRDITERKRIQAEHAALLERELAARKAAEGAQQRLEFLAEASAVLVGSLDPHTTLERVGRLTVPSLADWCLVDLVNENRTIRRVAVAHADPSRGALAQEVHRRYPSDWNAAGGVPFVLRTGQSELVSEVSEPWLVARGRDAEHLNLMRQMGMTSRMTVPLIARERTLGAITLISAESGRRYGPADLALAEELAYRAALAVDNAALFKEEQRRAATLGILNRLAAAIHAARGVQQTMQAVAEAAHRLCGDGVAYAAHLESAQATAGRRRWSLARFPPEAPGPLDETEIDRLLSAAIGSERVPGSEHLSTAQGGAARRQDARPGTSTLCLPITTRGGELLGAVLLPHPVAGRFDQEMRHQMESLARQAGVALENALQFERQRGIAETLQRSLLPERLPEVPGMAAAARYLPGYPEAVGGDWYDVLALPRGEVGLVMGDVAGRGVRAAAVMGQLRNALRAYAFEGHTPARIADRLNHMLDLGEMATLVYLVFDPASWRLRYANAGHLPPLIIAPDGATTFLGRGSVPLGGTLDPVYQDEEIEIQPGSTIVLYTDGLIEVRGIPIDVGLERLRAAVGRHDPADLDVYVDQVVRDVLGERPAPDDAALLAVRATALDPRRLALRLPAVPSSLPAVRRSLRRWLEQTGATEPELFEISVACSEACANAVEHAYGAADATVEVIAEMSEAEVIAGMSQGEVIAEMSEGEVIAEMGEEEVSLTVRDWGQWRAPRGKYRGRGLAMMKALMDAVDVATSEGGTTVRMRRRLGAGTRP